MARFKQTVDPDLPARDADASGLPAAQPSAPTPVALDQPDVPAGPAPVPPVQDLQGDVPSQELRPGRSAASTTYVGIGVGLVVMVVILIFVIQNLHDASIHFFTADFSLPIGLLILAAAVGGGLVVLLASGARVLQLRRSARKHRKAHEGR